MFFFKKNKRKSIIDAAHDLKNEVEGEALPAEIGMAPDEIERLLELLGRDNETRTVFRRRVGSTLDVAKGQVLWLRPYRLTIEEAKELIHEIAERYKEREKRLLKKRRRKNTDYQLSKLMSPDEIKYPSHLSPDDVLAASDTARNRLEKPRPYETENAEERRAKRIFEALEQMKAEEATRFARQVAMIQRHHIEGKPFIAEETQQEGGDEPSDVWAAHGIDDEELERIRVLQGFGAKPMKTLIDEAGDVVDSNMDAAAKVVKQWIGNPANEKE
ncbi:MAG: hypothetical protein FWD31_09030 [Planctomycetaceae bacterium]|nr:hypothetical protein [Planctomycetaceae bacterium]